MKPLKLPGEKDPTQAICTCPHCNSCVDQKTHECQNCHQIIVPNMGQPHPRKVPQKGERYDDYGPKLDYIIQAGSGRGRKKDKDLAEHDEDTVKDEFSTEVDMCIDPFEKKRRNVDVSKEEVMRSCEDLAIDG
jgi:hypothetical protein